VAVPSRRRLLYEALAGRTGRRTCWVGERVCLFVCLFVETRCCSCMQPPWSAW
jgi:hypothetical protein